MKTIAILSQKGGTGKSSLIKACLNEFAPRGLRLIEVDKADLVDLPDLVDLVAARPERFVVFCDDLSFDEGEPGYKALKSILDGSVAQASDNVLIYATSNRRLFTPGARLYLKPAKASFDFQLEGDALAARGWKPDYVAIRRRRDVTKRAALDSNVLVYAELEPAAFCLNEGEISPVLESPVGLHILRCDEIFPGGMIPFSEVCQRIIERLTDKRRRETQQAGAVQVAQAPAILAALNPVHAWDFLSDRGWRVFVALGAIVLALTGAEALYADMGHFGRRPIQLAWTGLVMPSLALNYLGQGALLMSDPSALENPFYRLFPDAWVLPAVLLATAAAIIASQAVISGAYSMTQQAILLGFLPRMRVRHTSAREAGQIYMPAVNWVLLVGVIAAVLHFGSSSALAAAYGIAVTLTMLITTVLTWFVVRRAWRIPAPIAVAATASSSCAPTASSPPPSGLRPGRPSRSTPWRRRSACARGWRRRTAPRSATLRCGAPSTGSGWSSRSSSTWRPAVRCSASAWAISRSGRSSAAR